MIATQVQDHKKDHDMPAGLRVSGMLVMRPVIGLLMVVLGGLIFGGFAYNLQTQGPLLKYDLPIANDLHALALTSPVFVTNIMIAGFYIGKQLVTAIAALLIVYYLYKRFWRELAMVIIGFGGGGLLWYLLSNYYNRPRPVFDHQVWIVLKDGGFPSGHTLSAVVCYGFLAYLFSSNITSRIWKWMIVVIAIGLILFIGFSRLYLGDHYLSDVLAGYALGIFWAGLVYTSIEVISEKWRKRYVSKG